MTKDTDIAWAAGLFEGEGCFSSSQNRVRASMASTDKDVLEKFRGIVDCGSIGPGGRLAKAHHKECWQWWANGDDFVKVFLMLEPWLCERRRKKGAEVFKSRTDYHNECFSERKCERCGVAFFPNPRGATTKARVAGAIRTRYCTEECCIDAKKERRIINRAVFKPTRVKLPGDE